MKLKTLLLAFVVIASLTQCKKSNTDDDSIAWGNAIVGMYENDSVVINVVRHEGKLVLGILGLNEPLVFSDVTMNSASAFTLNEFPWVGCHGTLVFSGTGTVINKTMTLYIHQEGTDTSNVNDCFDDDIVVSNAVQTF